MPTWLARLTEPLAVAFRQTVSGTPDGLPPWALWIVGALKVSCALCLVAGVWVPSLVAPAAGVVATLMLGAISMHLKVRDPWIKSLPAGTVLTLAAFVRDGRATVYAHPERIA